MARVSSRMRRSCDQAADRDLKLGPEIMQLPAQVVDQPRARADQALPMIDKQPDIKLDTGQLRDRERLDSVTDRRTGDRDRIDRIGLAALPHTVTRAGCQLRRDSHHPLPARQEKPLERPRHVPAILKRPHALAAHPARPPQQILKRMTSGAHRAIRKHPACRLLQRRGRVRGLVRVRPDHDHLSVPPVGIARNGLPVDTAQLGRSHAPIKSDQESTGRWRAT